MLQQVLAGAFGSRRIEPMHLAEAAQRAPEMRKIDAALGVVVR